MKIKYFLILSSFSFYTSLGQLMKTEGNSQNNRWQTVQQSPGVWEVPEAPSRASGSLYPTSGKAAPSSCFINWLTSKILINQTVLFYERNGQLPTNYPFPFFYLRNRTPILHKHTGTQLKHYTPQASLQYVRPHDQFWPLR